MAAVMARLPSPRRWLSCCRCCRRRRWMPGPTVVLDRVQDAGNVGSMLRSAATFGFTQIAALTGTALLWSPRCCAPAWGAQFGLRLVEGLTPMRWPTRACPVGDQFAPGSGCTAPARLAPCLVLGHEGRACSRRWRRAVLALRIAQPGGEESLNVAAVWRYPARQRGGAPEALPPEMKSYERRPVGAGI